MKRVLSICMMLLLFSMISTPVFAEESSSTSKTSSTDSISTTSSTETISATSSTDTTLATSSTTSQVENNSSQPISSVEQSSSPESKLEEDKNEALNVPPKSILQDSNPSKMKKKDQVFVDGAIFPGDLVVDGNFDDWEDKPKAELLYDTWQTDRKSKISMLTDGENLYGYLSAQGVSSFDGSTFKVKVNGKKTVNFEATLYHKGTNQPVQWGEFVPNMQYDAKVRALNHTSLGIGVVTVTEYQSSSPNPWDEPKMQFQFEFSISYDNLRDYGVKFDTLDSVEFSNHSYGRGSIIMQGTSTGVFMSVGISAVFAGIGYVFFKRKREDS